jgi:glycerol uptake facilitator-like aquaporin
MRTPDGFLDGYLVLGLCVAQIVAIALGAFLACVLYGVLKMNTSDVVPHIDPFSLGFGPGISFCVEFVGTVVLCFGHRIFVDERKRFSDEFTPFNISYVLISLTFAFYVITGALFNPMGHLLFSLIAAGYFGEPVFVSTDWIYYVGPLAGMFVFALVYYLLFEESGLRERITESMYIGLGSFDMEKNQTHEYYKQSKAVDKKLHIRLINAGNKVV